MSILSAGKISPSGPFGEINKLSPDPRKAICFSEKPFDSLVKLAVHRNSVFGISFKKDFLKNLGANRVWYVEKNTDPHKALSRQAIIERNSSTSDIWALAPYIEVVTGKRTDGYDFDWEREWRVLQDVSFSPEDVRCLFLPSDLHEAARYFFEDAKIENTGPCYDCEYIDPLMMIGR